MSLCFQTQEKRWTLQTSRRRLRGGNAEAIWTLQVSQGVWSVTEPSSCVSLTPSALTGADAGKKQKKKTAAAFAAAEEVRRAGGSASRRHAAASTQRVVLVFQFGSMLDENAGSRFDSGGLNAMANKDRAGERGGVTVI